jgi:hypothetical protein
MTTITQEPEAPEVARIERVEDLPDPVRGEIVADRQAGLTLSELKSKYAHVAPDVIREVLPPANQRERKQREAKQPKGGKAPQAKSEPEPKAAPEPRYATDLGDLPDEVLAARMVVGRSKLAELLNVSGSAVWRFEAPRGRVHPEELDTLRDGIAKVHERIAAGEFVKVTAEPKTGAPSKAEAIHRLEIISKLVQDARGAKTLAAVRGYLDEIGKVVEPASEEPTA